MSDIKDEVKYVPSAEQKALIENTEKELEKTISISHHTEMTNEIKAALFDKEIATLYGMTPFCVGTEQEIIYGCLPVMRIQSPTVSAFTSVDILKRRKADEPIRLMSMHSICDSGLDGISEDFKTVWACVSGIIDVDNLDKEIYQALRLDDEEVPLEGTKDKPLLVSVENLYQRLMYLDFLGMGPDHGLTHIIIVYLVKLLTRDGADIKMIHKIQKFCSESQRENLAVMLPEVERASYILGALPDGFDEIKQDLLKLHENKATHLQISNIRSKPILCQLTEFKELTVEDVTGVNLETYAEWWRTRPPPNSYAYSHRRFMKSRTRMHDELVYLFYTQVVHTCKFDEDSFRYEQPIMKNEFVGTGCSTYRFKTYKTRIQNGDYLLVYHPGLESLRSGDVTGSDPLWVLLDQTPYGEIPRFLTDTGKYTVRLLKSKSM